MRTSRFRTSLMRRRRARLRSQRLQVAGSPYTPYTKGGGSSLLPRPATGHPHIWNHDVETEEVEEVLTTPEEDRPGRDGSRIAHGQTAGGRHLKVVYVRDPKPDSFFVITGYELRGRPLLAYRRRKRRKHQ